MVVFPAKVRRYQIIYQGRNSHDRNPDIVPIALDRVNRNVVAVNLNYVAGRNSKKKIAAASNILKMASGRDRSLLFDGSFAKNISKIRKYKNSIRSYKIRNIKSAVTQNNGRVLRSYLGGLLWLPF